MNIVFPRFYSILKGYRRRLSQCTAVVIVYMLKQLWWVCCALSLTADILSVTAFVMIRKSADTIKQTSLMTGSLVQTS